MVQSMISLGPWVRNLCNVVNEQIYWTIHFLAKTFSLQQNRVLHPTNLKFDVDLSVIDVDDVEWPSEHTKNWLLLSQNSYYLETELLRKISLVIFNVTSVNISSEFWPAWYLQQMPKLKTGPKAGFHHQLVQLAALSILKKRKNAHKKV